MSEPTGTRPPDGKVPGTPSQTVGPFLSVGLPWDEGPYVVPEGTRGAVWIRGTVYDGAGEPVPDGLVETWQADPYGRFPHPDAAGDPAAGFRGFGRCPTDSRGEYAILTQLPGAVPWPNGQWQPQGQAPHIDVSVFARGLLHRVVTRIYFPDNAERNATDPVLATVSEQRRGTLLARPAGDGYRFDVRLQGERETVFFDV